MDYLDDDNEVTNPGALPDPTCASISPSSMSRVAHPGKNLAGHPPTLYAKLSHSPRVFPGAAENRIIVVWGWVLASAHL